MSPCDLSIDAALDSDQGLVSWPNSGMVGLEQIFSHNGKFDLSGRSQARCDIRCAIAALPTGPVSALT